MLLPFPAQRPLAAAMAAPLHARVGDLEWRHFPDGESLVTLDEHLDGADVAIVASLRDVDALALALRFAAATAREFGARSVGLVAPYLAYMRQDKRFRPGEAVSAPLFARFLEAEFDWLVTVDPHLHRIPSLDRVYRIPTRTVDATALVAGWIGREVPDAVLIGPDQESRQWIARIAGMAGMPFQVLEKQRRGDREVSVSELDAGLFRGRNPVLVDDIVSSGHTMIEVLRQLDRLHLPPATCVAIHAVFADDSFQRLLAAGAARVVSTDTIVHASNAISVAGLLAQASFELLHPGPRPAQASGRVDQRIE
ncbi:MAG: ribose-phosphate diphosphokinase [Arenimonas sp.]